MKITLALFATVLVACVGKISSETVTVANMKDSDIKSDLNQLVKLYIRDGATIPVSKLHHDLKIKILVTRGIIPSDFVKGSYRPVRGTRCLFYDGYSIFRHPDNTLMILSNDLAAPYHCSDANIDLKTFYQIHLLLTDAMFQAVLQGIPSALPAYVDKVGGLVGPGVIGAPGLLRAGRQNYDI